MSNLPATLSGLCIWINLQFEVVNHANLCPLRLTQLSTRCCQKHLVGFLTRDYSLAEIKQEPFEDENWARAAQNSQRLPGQQAEDRPGQSRAHEAFQHSLQQTSSHSSRLKDGPSRKE